MYYFAWINYNKIISHNSFKFTDKGNEHSKNSGKSTKQLFVVDVFDRVYSNNVTLYYTSTDPYKKLNLVIFVLFCIAIIWFVTAMNIQQRS